MRYHTSYQNYPNKVEAENAANTNFLVEKFVSCHGQIAVLKSHLKLNLETFIIILSDYETIHVKLPF